MKRNFFLAVLFFVPTLVLAAADDIPGGTWELRTRISAAGMPADVAAEMAKSVISQCVKAGERKWTESPRGGSGAVGACEKTLNKGSGQALSWKLKCADGTVGEGTYDGKDSFTMTTTVAAAQGNAKVTIEGKRTSPTCDKK